MLLKETIWMKFWDWSALWKLQNVWIAKEGGRNLRGNGAGIGVDLPGPNSSAGDG
jgi:hypothetical protein